MTKVEVMSDFALEKELEKQRVGKPCGRRRKEATLRRKYAVPVQDLDSGDETSEEVDPDDSRCDREQVRRYRKTCCRRRTAIKGAT